MSASGVISNVDLHATRGDNLTSCWRLWVTLDNPRAIPETGPEPEFSHDWIVDIRPLPAPPPIVGNRITISSHGGTGVTVTDAAGRPTDWRAFESAYSDQTIR